MPDPPTQRGSVTAALTFITVLAFASNSILCRVALATEGIDPASFTAVRIVSGALTLWCVSAFIRRRGRPKGSWLSASMLALYAVAFSFAYISLGIGTGAMIVMGSVQATMIIGGIRTGERPGLTQWIGALTAMGGLVYLTSPGAAAPPPAGSLLMICAGFAWGVYSLRGRGSADPVTTTTDNFLRAVPMVLVVNLIMFGGVHWSAKGMILGLVSGSLTSGLGYVVWYAALRGLTATRAAVVQLAVPVVAAMGGVVLLSEVISTRLVVASVIILGGVGLTLFGQDRRGENGRSRWSMRRRRALISIRLPGRGNC